jgi:hypothetical protein
MKKKETRQKLYELKTKTYECWLSLLEVNQAFHISCEKPSEDKVFKKEMRFYGDLRRKDTWEKAYAAVMARFLWSVNDDNKFLIEFYLIQQSKEEGWRYLLPRVVEEYMMLPGGAESLAQGLSEFGYYGCEYKTQASDVEEFANVYFGTARKLSLTAG